MAPKNFDDEQRERQQQKEAAAGDRTFVFRGETFTHRANVRYGVIKDIAGIAENTDGTAVFETVESAVYALLEDTDSGHERFRAVCQSDVFPVTFEDLGELLNWMIEVQTERPPTQSEPSSTGSTQNGTPSTVTSSDAPAVA